VDGAIASSSVSVGRRFSANSTGLKPPIDVMNAPIGALLMRARYVAAMSANEVAFSSGVCQPLAFAFAFAFAVPVPVPVAVVLSVVGVGDVRAEGERGDEQAREHPTA